MLDALKGLAGSNKAAQKQADEFQSLIAAEIPRWRNVAKGLVLRAE